MDEAKFRFCCDGDTQFRMVFNKISTMEPFVVFFRVLLLDAIEIEWMQKTCMATLCAEKSKPDRAYCRSFETLHCHIFLSYTGSNVLQADRTFVKRFVNL